MRKVLLATTALVAVTGVTAAHADISISGNIEFEFESQDAGTDTMSTDGQLIVESTMTADSGVTYGVTYAQKMEASGVDQFNASISSPEMGTILLGNHNDNGPGMIDGSLGRNNDIESENYNTNADTALSGLSGDMITYVSPSIGGLTVAASSNANTDMSGFGARYQMSGMEVYFGSVEDQQNMGAKTSIAGLTIAVGAKKVDGTTAKSNDIAVKYTLANGVTLAGVSARGTDSNGAKSKYSNIGAKYTIAPGVAAKIEAGDNAGAAYTYVSFDVNF
jgi:hypothetical protein